MEQRLWTQQWDCCQSQQVRFWMTFLPPLQQVDVEDQVLQFVVADVQWYALAGAAGRVKKTTERRSTNAASSFERGDLTMWVMAGVLSLP